MPPVPSRYRLIWPALLWLVATLVHWWTPGTGRLPGWLPAVAIEDVQLAAGTLAWLALAWLGLRLFGRLAVEGRPRPVPQLLSDMVAVALFGLALVAILALVFHQPVTGLLATSGVVVAVLGFALRDIISDIFSGVALNLEHPYAIGDWLEVQPGGPVGKVVEITWRATRLITLDQIMVVVPNGNMSRNKFQNYSAPNRFFRANISVVIDFDVPVERAHRLLLSATRNLPPVLDQPAPDVVAEAFTERGVRYLIRYWVPDYADYVYCRHLVAASIDRHLRLGGVALPHSRQDITVARASTVTDPIERRAALLTQLDLFKALDDDDRRQLCEGLTVRSICARDAVVREGEPGASLFLVVEGHLEVEAGGSVLASLRPGDVFGEMSLLTGAPRNATVVAATDATLFEISDLQMRPILHRQPDLAAALGAIVAERIRMRHDRASRIDAPAEGPAATPLLARIREFFGLAR